MEESVDLHEEAGKENEQTLANLSPAEEATSKDKEQKSKNTQYKTNSDLNVPCVAWKKFCESLKEFRAIEIIPSPFVNKMTLSTSRIL